MKLGTLASFKIAPRTLVFFYMTTSGTLLERFGLRQKIYVTKEKSVRGETSFGMVLETFGLGQTRYVTEGKSVGGEAPSGLI